MNEDQKILEDFRLITRNLEEITENDKIELKNIIKERPLKIYWGTAITGKPHIGYFLPIIKIKDFLLANCEVTILFADIHGFLDNLKAPIDKIEKRFLYYKKLIRSMLKRVLLDETALERLKFVKGSDFQKSPEYVFDLYKISSFTTERDVKRAGSDVVKQMSNCFLSSLIYPNMQALDEEYLKVDAQFGGADQRKIFMHAKKFLPKVGYKKRIHLMNPMMGGLDSEKMSSSDEKSKIDLLDSEKTIGKKIRKCFCEEGNPKSGVLSIFKFVIFPFFEREILQCTNFEELKNKFENKEIHPKELKEECSKLLEEIISPIRQEMLEDELLIKEAYE